MSVVIMDFEVTSNRYFEHVTKNRKSHREDKNSSFHLNFKKKVPDTPKGKKINKATCKDPGCIQGHGMTI